MSTHCELAGICSGCGWIKMPYEAQLKKKRALLSSAFKTQGLLPPDVEIQTIGEFRTRERVDLTWQKNHSGNMALGLFDQTHKEILDLKACPQMTEALEAWFLEFKALTPPHFLEKGSVRLRVSPTGARGAWLDFSHADTKLLFEEKSWLKSLLSKSHVEIGQRRKPLSLNEKGELKLEKTIRPFAWFETYLSPDLESTPLASTIGSFTQPGRKANKALIQGVFSLLKGFKPCKVLELFSGLGNFTLPLASLGHEVFAFEVDPTAGACLAESLKHTPELKAKIHFFEQSVYTPKALPSLSNYDLLFVDPPRSGLKQVLSLIENTSTGDRPKTLMYVSCYLESFADDLKKLSTLGYEIQNVLGVDQFPQSPHCEWIAVLHKT